MPDLQLCRLSSINPQVFNEARSQLGPDVAIAALAITVERAAQGSVLNPGAYLRSLTKRGHMGNLHLTRSLFALAEKNCEQGTQ
ncbi:replication initiation protein RepC [Phyllobacterium sp. TAF24]|uniref:replication initiation protein RepC n=1 Tax=Phyllobacterium sp. TAF24 TaxID=3233068 RepID=UPI003F9E6F64